MAAVTIRNVAKRFDSVVVMHDIDLDVADGEFIVLVGASGCGKSTLLRMIAGLEPISAGEIAIGGRRVNELEPRERDVAMVFQTYALYPHLDVRENMSFSLRLRNRPEVPAEQDLPDPEVRLPPGLIAGPDPLRTSRPTAGGESHPIGAPPAGVYIGEGGPVP